MDKLSLSAAKKLVNANVNDHEEKLIEEDDETYGYTSFAASLLSANEYWRSIKNEILGIKENFDSENEKIDNELKGEKEKEDITNIPVNEENEKAEALFGISEDDENITKEVDNKKSEKKESLKDKIKRKKESIKEKVNKRFEKIKQKLLTEDDDDDTDDSSEDLTKEEPVKNSPKIMEDSKKSGGGVENEFGSQSSNGGSGISGINSVSSSEQSDKTGSDMMLVNEEQEEEKEDDDNDKEEDEEENKKEEDNENNKDEIKNDENKNDEIKNDNLQNINNQNEIGSPSGSATANNFVGSNGSSGGSITTDSSSDSDISSISTDESKEDNDAIKSIDFKKTDDEEGIDAEKIGAPTKMSNILEVAKNIMKKSDGIYGVDGRNYIASILDILMKDQSSQPEKKSTEKAGKTKSKLNRKQTSSKLNPSIKKLKSGLQSLYEEYPPLDNEKQSSPNNEKKDNSNNEKQSSPMPEELKNNENIMRYAIKADFLNDAEKLIRDTLSQIYVVEKNNSQGNLSNFSIQGKRAIVILSTLLRQENNEGGNKENSYAHQYELMRKVISVRKKSSYSSHRRGKKTESFETNLPHMRVLGIALNSILNNLKSQKSDGTTENDKQETNTTISTLKKYAKIFAYKDPNEIKKETDGGKFKSIYRNLKNTLDGKYNSISGNNDSSILAPLQDFLEYREKKDALALLCKCTGDYREESKLESTQLYSTIYSKQSDFSNLINEEPYNKLFYQNNPK